jgi:hypothetical protein
MKHIWLVAHEDIDVEFEMDNYTDVEMEDIARADQLNIIDPASLQHIRNKIINQTTKEA